MSSSATLEARAKAFKLFADAIFKLVQDEEEDFYTFSNDCFKEFGKGIVMMQPEIDLDYEVSKLPEMECERRYISLTQIQAVQDEDFKMCMKDVTDLLAFYEPEADSDFIIHVMPHDDDALINTCYTKVFSPTKEYTRTKVNGVVKETSKLVFN
jgi:hypothetical protein